MAGGRPRRRPFVRVRGSLCPRRRLYRRCRGWRLQSGRLLENLPLEQPQAGPWLEAELTGEIGASPLIYVECVGLASRPVQGQHQLRRETFPAGLIGEPTLELADELGVVAKLEIGIDSSLERGEM
jgi:hypothetical protein